MFSNSRGTNFSSHDLVEGDFVDVRTLILEHNHDVMSESVSPEVFCFVSSRAPLRNSVAMAAIVETSACAAAASIAEDAVSTASGGSSSAASSPGTPVAKVRQPRGVDAPVVEASRSIDWSGQRCRGLCS